MMGVGSSVRRRKALATVILLTGQRRIRIRKPVPTPAKAAPAITPRAADIGTIIGNEWRRLAGDDIVILRVGSISRILLSIMNAIAVTSPAAPCECCGDQKTGH